jgi:hypothetical protein
MDFETWDKLMEFVENMHEELLGLYEKQQGGVE